MDPKKNTEQPVIPEVMVQMTSVVCDEILKFLSKRWVKPITDIRKG